MPQPFDAQKLIPTSGSFLEKAIETKQAHLSFDDKGRRVITYLAAPGSRKEIYDDPEEQVRAEFWAELLHRYHYPAHRVALEFPVPDRAPKDFADIVVFSDDERKAPYIVVEVKKENISAAEFSQAIEQAFGNGHAHKFHAKYIAVVAGATKSYFDLDERYKVGEREANVLADLPTQYGKVPEYRFFRGGNLDLQAVSKESLIAAMGKCHDTLWGGGRFSPTVAFGEMCKLVFAKSCDEREPRKKGEPYEFQIRTHETPSMLLPRINALYEKYRSRERDSNVFDGSIKVPDWMLIQAVQHLQGINLLKTDLDTKGVAFERFMSKFFKEGNGQYFTPRELIQFAVEMFPPQKTDRVLDPACGSGGFLLHCLDFIRREANDKYPDFEDDRDEGIAHFQYWHSFAEHNLFGIELSEEIARVAKMNMILHDDGHTNVIAEDALEKFERFAVLRSGFGADSFDLIHTNPPFGATVSFENKKHLLELFPSLAKSSDAKGSQKDRKNQKTEILFLERIHQFLREGGRAAVVLPDGILTNSSLAYVRDFLLERFQIKAVVSFPQSAFSHFGAGVKSSLVFLEKRMAGEVPHDDEAIFMAAPENIGYDAAGRKTWKLIETQTHTDGSWTETIRCDLFDAKIRYEIKGTEKFEGPREVVHGSGLLGEYQKFCQNAEPFFV